jgi:hypothetical protein
MYLVGSECMNRQRGINPEHCSGMSKQQSRLVTVARDLGLECPSLKFCRVTD